MTLETPESVTLPDGSRAQVKGVAATVDEGRIIRVVYTLEKLGGALGGAWIEVAGDALPPAQ